MNQIVGTSYFYLRQLFGTKVKIPEEFVSYLPVVELPVQTDNDTDNPLGPVYESQSIGNVILNDGDKTIALLDVAEQRTDYNTLRQQPKPVIASNLEKTPLLLSINPRGLPVNPELIQLRNKMNQSLRGGRNPDATVIIDLINEVEEMIPQTEEEQTLVDELKETLETATAIALGDTDVLQEKLENIETQPPDLPEASSGIPVLPEAPVPIPSVESGNIFSFFNFGQSSVQGEMKIDTSVAQADKEAADAKVKADKEAADAKVKAEKEDAEAREKVEKEAADAKSKAEKEAADAKLKAEKETAEAVTASYIKAAADKVKAIQIKDEAEKQAELQRIEKEKEEVKKQAELKETEKKEKADKELKSRLKIIQAFNQQKLKKLAVERLNRLKEEAKQKALEKAKEEAEQKEQEEAKQRALEEEATIKKTIQEQSEISDEDVRTFFDAIDIFDELNKDDIMKNHLNILKTIFQEAKQTYKKEEQNDVDSVEKLIELYNSLKGIAFKAFLNTSLKNKLKLFKARQRRDDNNELSETRTEQESQPTRGQRKNPKYGDTDKDISSFFDSLNERMENTFYDTLDIKERPNADIARKWYLKMKNIVKKKLVTNANETNETNLTPEEAEQLWKSQGIQYIIDKIYTNPDPSDKQIKIDIIRKKYDESVKEPLFERKLLSSSGKREPPSDGLIVESLEPDISAKSGPVKDKSSGVFDDMFTNSNEDKLSVNYLASQQKKEAEEKKTRETSKFPTFEKLYQSQQRYFTDSDTKRYEFIWDKIRGNKELNQPGISLSSFKLEDIAKKIETNNYGNDATRLRDLIKANSEYNKTINAQTSKYKDTPKFTPSSGNRDMSYPKPGTLQQVLKKEKEQEKDFLTQEQYDYNTTERKKMYVNTMNEYKRLYKDNITVLYPMIRGIQGYRQFDKLGSIDKVAILVAYKELLQKYTQTEIRYTYTNSLNQQKEIRISKKEELQEIERMIQKIKIEHPEINWKDITEQ